MYRCFLAWNQIVLQESELFGEALGSLGKEMTTLEYFMVPENENML